MLEKQIENIRKFFDNKKYDEAFAIADAAFKQNSDNYELKIEIAKLYFVRQEYLLSEKIFLELQKKNDFFVLSTEMLQKIYKILGFHNKSIIQFYKLYRTCHNITEYNVIDALDSALALKKYDIYIKILKVAYNKKIYTYDFINNKLNGIYDNIIKLISDYNAIFNYEKVKKIYRTIINLIPKCEKKVRNILLNEYEIATGCYQLKSKPRILTLELTNKCNLKCKMCEYKNVKKHWEITENVYDELINLMPYLEHLILQGGEVFLYKNIKQLLSVAVKEKVSIEIVTNGLLLSEEIIKLLMDGKNIITFSIDSIIKDTYEKIRVGGNFDRLIGNLNKLFELKKTKANGIILRLHMVVMKSNYNEIENIINFAGKYGFNEVYLEPVANKYVGKEESIFEFGYDKGIVSILENKKDIFYDLAKRNNIKLINHLPSTKYCDSICNTNFDGFKTKTVRKIKDFLWLFKIRKENNMNYNYASKIYYNLKFNEKTFKNNRLFCYAPWQKLSLYNKNISLPTCFCPVQHSKIMLNPFLESLKNSILYFLYRKNFIMSKWNSKLMMYYRKTMILQQEQKVCAKDCLENRISLKERSIRY